VPIGLRCRLEIQDRRAAFLAADPSKRFVNNVLAIFVLLGLSGKAIALGTASALTWEKTDGTVNESKGD
jgi:hypothetical protein